MKKSHMALRLGEIFAILAATLVALPTIQAASFIGMGDLPGWTLSFASGISADGSTIVGQGTNHAGRMEAYIATLDTP